MRIELTLILWVTPLVLAGLLLSNGPDESDALSSFQRDENKAFSPQLAKSETGSTSSSAGVKEQGEAGQEERQLFLETTVVETQPTAAESTESAAEPATPSVQFFLKGIASADGGNWAIFASDGPGDKYQVVEQGDRLGDFVVERVLSDRVVLTDLGSSEPVTIELRGPGEVP